MAPEDIQSAVDSCPAISTFVTERGSMFGYHQLVVDMTSLIQNCTNNLSNHLDATHSCSPPSGHGNHSMVIMMRFP